MSADADTIVIGKVLKPRGQKGELTVYPITDDPKRFLNLSSVIIEKKNGTVIITEIQSVRFHKDILIIKFKGIDTPVAAWEFEGSIITISESDAMPLPHGHYYLDDVIGCSVFDEEGMALGTVKEIYKTAGNDVFVIKSESGEILVPAIESFILEVSTKDKRITIKKPEYV
ncbi:MAG: 16S rRNA processing protein RimM [Candidatus Schekmanbacteria bacterium]|nr:16S rRNA processing protein RimM [Candidatus Schekmanbacteria bacterium]